MKSNTVERIQIDHHRVLWDSLIKEGNTFPWSVFHITPEYSMHEEGCCWHKAPEIIVVRKGTMHLTLDGRKTVVNEGEIRFIHSCCLHTYSCENVDGYIVVISYFYLKDRIHHFDHMRVSDQAQYDEILKEMMYEFIRMEESEQENRLLTQIFFDMIIHYISNKHLTDVKQGSVSAEATVAFAQEVIQYLEKHFTQRFDSAVIAESFHLSYPHIARQFKKQTGKSILQVLNDIRSRKSLSMLENSDMTMEQISDSLGFPNVKSFENAFKKRFKRTPYQYQKMTRNHQ